MNLPIFELFIEEEDEFLGLALVDKPAIEKDYIYFDEQEIKMEFNDEQMIVKGPALIPDKLIYRNDSLGERYVYFSKETIKKFAELLINKNKEKFNVDHTDKFINANIIESYFASKDNEFGVEEGSWIVSLHILDNSVWNKIKSGEYKGFSVQGLFSNEIVKFMKNNKNDKKMELKEKLLNAINSILFGEETPEVIETPVVEVPEVVEETPEVVEVAPQIDYNEHFVKMNEAITSLTQKLEQYDIKFNELKTLVEEYSKQPISQSVVVEEVATTKPIKGISNATKYFQK